MNVCGCYFHGFHADIYNVLGSDDGSVRLWNTETGQQLHVYDGLGKVSRARFCYHDSSILIEMNKKLTVRATKTGTLFTDIAPSIDRLLGLTCLSDFCTRVFPVSSSNYYISNCIHLFVKFTIFCYVELAPKLKIA